ncbi:hypothetical protein LINGRAHAP2_LOCUS22327 [Linum grandiflorum]
MGYNDARVRGLCGTAQVVPPKIQRNRRRET